MFKSFSVFVDVKHLLVLHKNNGRESSIFRPETSQKGRLAVSIPFPAITTVLIFYCISFSDFYFSFEDIFLPFEMSEESS